jgi:hypothetical protein
LTESQLLLALAKIKTNRQDLEKEFLLHFQLLLVLKKTLKTLIWKSKTFFKALILTWRNYKTQEMMKLMTLLMTKYKKNISLNKKLKRTFHLKYLQIAKKTKMKK